MDLTVGDYHYNYNYLVQLEKYYSESVSLYGFGKLCKLHKEIERLKKLLKLDKCN